MTCKRLNRITVAGLTVESNEDIYKLSKVADKLLSKHKNFIIQSQPIEVYR